MHSFVFLDLYTYVYSMLSTRLISTQGPGEKGAVWVAVRVPDGYVSSHANQARIRTFPRDSPDVLYAPDVVEFAK